MVKNNFTISLGKLDHEPYLELVNYLIKQEANGKSSAGAHSYDKKAAIFDLEVGSVSKIPPIYNNIKISFANQKFEEEKVKNAVRGLVELLAKLEKE